MNEVWGAVMNAVVMAIVAQAHPVANFVAQLREILNRLDVMRLKSFVRAALLADVSVALKNGIAPSNVFRASPSLTVIVTGTLCHALALYTAICVFKRLARDAINHTGIWASKFLAAHFANTESCFVKTATPLTTIVVFTPDMRRGALKLLPAIVTGDRNFLGESLVRTFARTIFALEIARPTMIRLFLDNPIANLTPFQFLFHATIIAGV